MGNQKRNVNLDAIRTFAIIGVVALHLIGGVKALPLSFGNELIVNIVLAITYCSVNLFGLLSGYIKIDRPHHNSSIIKIILQTSFWCFVIAAVCAMAFGQRSMVALIKNSFPFIGDRLWYVTCYVFVFLGVPYFNLLANRSSQIGYKNLLIILTILMSFITTFMFKDFFHIVNYGYSAAWLAYMYLVGGYFKRYGFNKKIRKGHVWIVLCISIGTVVVSKYILEAVLLKVGADTGRAWQFYCYSSPLTLLISVCILYLFVNTSIKNNILTKCLSWLSTVSFGIYIIHAHPYILDDILIGEKLKWIANDNPLLTLLTILGCIIGIVFVAGILEQLRIMLFRIVGIDKISNRIGVKLDKKLGIEEIEQN